MPIPPILALPSANRPAGTRARLGRLLRARLRGAPMSSFRGQGPQGRFVLVRDRAGQREPLLLLSASVKEGVSHADLTAALQQMPKAELVPGTWRRRDHTVIFQADQGTLDARDFTAALGRSGVEYRVLLLQVAA